MVTSIRNFDTERSCALKLCTVSVMLTGLQMELGDFSLPQGIRPSLWSKRALQRQYLLRQDVLACRGTVIGILKSFLGLSGSFFTTIYVSLS